jgi:zinc D-Ala-D-Ala dipeptidase
VKPHHQVPIVECNEPLVPIPPGLFAFENPHPYVKLGAPYGAKSPYYLRHSVVERLISAQTHLQQHHPTWRIQIFDAYRPLKVQQFMVDYTFQETVQAQGLRLEELTETQQQAIAQQVYQFWAIPSLDPTMPPPHSTGAAVDVTLVDDRNCLVDMGSPIDEMSLRSYPDYFSPTFIDPTPGQLTAASDRPFGGTALHRSLEGTAADRPNLVFHHNRQCLKESMTAAGFLQHPNEWWHFSYKDQMWVWLTQQHDPDCILSTQVAQYGAIEHLS